MPKLSIDLTEEEHRLLQAGAAKAGASLQDFVRACALSEVDDLSELEALLEPRIAATDRGRHFAGTVSDIAKRAREKVGR